MRGVFLSVIAAVLLTAAGAYAHHSYGATYDTGKEIKLEGKLVQFVYRNPHSFVHVQAPDADGVMHRWSVEWAGTAQLDNTGVPLVELLVTGGLCTSKGQARKDIEGGGVYLNNVRESNFQRAVGGGDLLFGKHLLLRKGKRNYVVLTAL